MEPKSIKELIPANLQTLLPTKSEYNNEVSIYTGQLTDKCLVSNVVMIKKAFPALPLTFYDVFMDMVKENNFNDTRLSDAVKHVICNCQYPTPTIANFISFDKRVKVYTYAEYCKLCDEGNGKNYQPVAMNGNSRPVWVHTNDINQYNLPLWKNL